MNAIEIENLVKVYPNANIFSSLFQGGEEGKGVTALDNVSLEIPEGEVLGLVGPNGAGKTTLINILCTLVIPTSGTARVGGKDVGRHPEEVRRFIGLVASNERSFYWRLTGLQNIRFFSDLYRIPYTEFAAWSNELMEALDIKGYANRRFDSFSTGIRQRFAFARALLHRPRIIFMDEPTKGLDPVASMELLRLIRERIIGAWNPTIIITSHNLREIEDLCGRVAIMSRSKIIRCERIQELLRSGAGGIAYRAVVQNLRQEVIEALGRIDGVTGFKVLEQGGKKEIQFRLKGEGKILSEILKTILSSGAEIHQCGEVAESLQDILTQTLINSRTSSSC